MQTKSKLGNSLSADSVSSRKVVPIFDGADRIDLAADGRSRYGRVFFIPILVPPEMGRVHMEFGIAVTNSIRTLISSEIIGGSVNDISICGFFISMNELMNLEPHQLKKLSSRLANSNGYLANEQIQQETSEIPILSYLAFGLTRDETQDCELHFRNWNYCKWRLEQLISSVMATTVEYPEVIVRCPALYREALVNGTVAAVTELKKYLYSESSDEEGETREIDVRLNQDGYSILQMSNSECVSEIVLDPTRIGTLGVAEIVAAALNRLPGTGDSILCN